MRFARWLCRNDWLQLDVRTRQLDSNCRLFTLAGDEVDADVDACVDEHFNTLLDGIALWRQQQTTTKDISLLSKKHVFAVFRVEKQIQRKSLCTLHLAEFCTWILF